MRRQFWRWIRRRKSEVIRANLAIIPVVCRGGPEAGPIGELPDRARFRWLVSPRSTIVQTSPVHTGRTDDAAACLEHLMDTVVRRPAALSCAPGSR